MTPLQLYEVAYFLRSTSKEYNAYLMTLSNLDPFERQAHFIAKQRYIMKFVRPEWIYHQMEGLGWETRYDRT
jgi:hypothetical protein